MKRAFWTGNLFIGVLMGLVLALGVQGTADAISRLTRSSGDLQTVTAGDDFQIRFTVTLQSPRRGSAYADFAQTPRASVEPDAVARKRNKNTYYEDDYSPEDPNTARGYQSEGQVTYDVAHDYEQESIAITVSEGAAIKKVGSNDVPNAEGTTLHMYESTHNMYSTTSNPHQRLSGSVALTLTAPADPAVVTITITPTTDGPTEHTEPSILIFTVYVVGALNYSGTTAVAAATDGVLRVSDQQDTPINSHFTFAPAEHQPVYYTVEGSGRLYVSVASDRKTTPTKNLYTSSSAPVYLDTTGGSSKVTAHIAGSSDTAKVLYVFSGARSNELPQIEVQGGDNQTGAPSGRLDNYFEVKVTDGRRRPISGLPVTFETPSSESESPAMFIPVSGTRIYADAELTAELIDAVKPTITVATPTSPDAKATHRVQTDRNGVAKIYYQLGNTPGVYTVTATAHGIGISTTLTATASSTARARLANLEIVSGNNQRGEKGNYLEDDLVVIVRSLAGHRVQEAIVQFRTTTGTLVPAEGTEQPETLFSQPITPGSTLNPTSGQQIYVLTGPDGEAGVSYNVGQVVEARTVIAEVREETQTDTQYDFAIDRVVFNINGKTTGTGTGTGTGTETGTGTGTETGTGTGTGSLNISLSGTGNTRAVTVTAQNAGGTVAPGISVVLNANNGATLSRTSGPTPFSSTLTLPATAGDYTLTATTTADYSGDTETITVTLPGTISLALIGSQVNGSQTVQVTARNAAGSLETSPVTVTLSGAGVSRTVSVTGSQNVPIPLPTTSGTLTASATRYNSGSITLPARSTTTTTTTTTTGTAGEADSIEIDGSRSLSGTVNQALRLRARVLDPNDRGVSGVRVTFRVLAPGKGRLSQRGNGRAVQDNTDRNGYATANLTPLGGNLIVEAKAAGVSAAVSFIIDVDGSAGDTGSSTTGDPTVPQTYTPGDKIPISLEGTLNFSNPRTLNGITYTCVGPGECVVSYGLVAKGQIQAAPAKTTPDQEYEVGDKIPISLEDTLRFTGRHTVNGTIYTCVGSDDCVVSYGLVTKGQIQVSAASATTPHTTEMNPEVLLAADRRPPLVWVDGGTIYALVGADVQAFASSIENVMNIAVSGNKLYWTEQTGENTGTINSVNLDGTGAKTLVEIKAVPRGIDVDPVAKRLYWTNSQGWMQSSNLEGTARKNIVSGGLEDPRGIAVSDGWVYWTQGNGRIQAVNLSGTKAVRNIATGTDAANDVAVFQGKVYWMQMTGASAGTINSVNLDGTGAKTLVEIKAVPRGIAVDPVAKRLYWTNSHGWIQSSNLQGTARRNVAKGLGTPNGIALSANITAPVAKSTPPKSTTTATNKYDLNGDGTVDVRDSDVLIVAVAAGATDAKYDVTGDGKVDINDIVAVTTNRSGGAAGAPTLLGMKLNALEVDRLQEQIELLIATNDRSPAAMRTLVYLQQLIAMARPEKTQLFANYPNPFNPETWMPYELATDTDVRITIYNAQGVVIRTLRLGQQSAGYYTDRERAAYWDGRNAFGEQVASGVYFYQLETDTMSALRKMVILK